MRLLNGFLIIVISMFLLDGCSHKEITQEVKLKKVEVPEVNSNVGLILHNAPAEDAAKVRNLFSELPDTAYIEGTIFATDSQGHASETTVRINPHSPALPKDLKNASNYIGNADVKVKQAPLQTLDTNTTVTEKKSAMPYVFWTVVVILAAIVLGSIWWQLKK